MDKLPTEILIDIIVKLEDFGELSKVSKFYNRFISENQNQICFEIMVKNGNKINYDDSYKIYKFYKENDIELTYNEENDDLYEAVYKASTFPNVEILKYYIDQINLDYDTDLEDLMEILINSACNGRTENIKFVLDSVEFYSNNEERINAANTLFPYAAKPGNLETIKYLLEIGADINIQNGCGLRYSMRNNDIDSIKFFLENGADISKVNHKTMIKCYRKNYEHAFDYMFELLDIKSLDIKSLFINLIDEVDAYFDSDSDSDYTDF